jgi:YHS domain-containing protein
MMGGWLLWLVIFGAFFFFMMRFGCGAHMAHGGHGGHGGGEHEGHTVSGGSAKDPVCGMVVESGRGYTENREGREFHFCSRNCLDKFDAEPRRYAS